MLFGASFYFDSLTLAPPSDPQSMERLPTMMSRKFEPHRLVLLRLSGRHSLH